VWRIIPVLVAAGLVMPAYGLVFRLTRGHMIKYTAKNPLERFPDVVLPVDVVFGDRERVMSIPPCKGQRALWWSGPHAGTSEAARRLRQKASGGTK